MKPVTKIIVFVLLALVIIIGITSIMGRKAEAPVMTENETATTTDSVRSITYTLGDVAKHATSTDCWTAVGENVYDLTPFVQSHPGGVENITKICGIDGTEKFTAQHGSTEKAQEKLATLKIGILTE